MVEKKKIPDGYKETEVGVIPVEWETHLLEDEIASLDAGVSVNSIEGTVMKNDYAILKTSAVYKGKFLPSESKKIRQNDIKRAKLNPTANSLIISRMNTPELVGECAYINSDYPMLFIPDRLWQTTLKKESKLNCKWLNYLLNTEIYRKTIKGLATGTSNSMKNISKQQLLSVRISFPDEKEQQAIAEALSDIDDTILSLEKFINKKKLIKQGAMQELLIGKKRLDGFSGEWENKSISQIGKFYGGLTSKSKVDFDKGNSYYIPFMNILSNPVIDTNYLDKVYIKEYEAQNLVNKGDLFFNTSSEIPEEVGMCSVLLEDIHNLYLNSFCFGFRLNDLKENNPLYLSYLFRGSAGRKMMFSLAQGVTRYNLSKANFSKLEIELPKYKEQSAIANILLDMDKEIEKLQIKLDKYKNMKRGMMEELLTGKRRLV